MSTFFNILSVVLFSGIIAKGNAQCEGGSNLPIQQTKTGNLVANKPEWSVTIVSTCSACALLDVYLTCDGFQSAENIDPSVLSQQGDLCLVNNGSPIPTGPPLSFKYAADQQYPFKVAKSQIACS